MIKQLAKIRFGDRGPYKLAWSQLLFYPIWKIEEYRWRMVRAYLHARYPDLQRAHRRREWENAAIEARHTAAACLELASAIEAELERTK